ncbi:YxeA family protein [Aureibacillus halotolerans]|uniref:Uncharacterized protein (TIGR01655 family) n=1 Tax=Aureibacillus halotolerans TaxID=1508390 RepID=A0A4R6TZ77_9BACI|nr:YxeA family protein [Aureibacillus halotolerans]TDQ37369.1 uncharacterized protein (TIGR01655 family) [Aureibacillus halotolerans]
MKKLLIAIIIIVVVVASFYLVYLFNREDLDRFNPLIEQEYVYAQITEAPEEANGRYKYTLTGFTGSGESKTVVFTTSIVLDSSTYVKVLAKGLYAESYEMVEEDDVPAN